METCKRVVARPVLKLPLHFINREFIFSAFLVCAFILTKSAVSLLLQECKRGHHEYPFVVQTVSVSAFVLQLVFYALQTMLSLGFIQGLTTLAVSSREMAPAIFYSALVALSQLLQTISLDYIDASLYIVLMQMTLVLVALGDRFIMKRQATFVLWCLVFAQTGIVICYVRSQSAYNMATQHNATTNSSGQVGDDGSQVIGAAVQAMGIAVCLTAECCSATGCILQQQFMQVAKPGLLVSIKLWYQHFFGVIVILMTTTLDWRNVDRIMRNGFFDGWDQQVFVTMLCMWLYAAVASAVTAYLSALTGAMAAAMVVVVISLFELFYHGKVLTILQFSLIVALVVNSGAYTRQKELLNNSAAKKKKV